MLLLAGHVPPSEKLGMLPGWGWLVDRTPGQAFLIMLLISPVAIKYILRPAVEGRILRRSDEFLSFQCDMLFAPALGCGLVLVRAMDDRVYFHRGIFDWVVLVLAFGLGAVRFYQERREYSWRALFTITKMGHELLFTFIGYVLATVCLFGLIWAPWTYELIVIRIVMLASITGWALSWPLYDEKHKHDRVDAEGHNRYWYAHVENAWPWQHKYRNFGMWWRRYLDDWAKTPARLKRLYRRITA